MSSARSPNLRRRSTKRKVVHYYLVNDHQALVLGRDIFYRAGPFAIHWRMNIDDLKVLQYVFQPLLDSRYELNLLINMFFFFSLFELNHIYIYSEPVVKLELGLISRKEFLTLGPGQWVGDGVRQSLNENDFLVIILSNCYIAVVRPV